MLKVGDQAPDFSALLDDETVFRLSDWQQPLLDYYRKTPESIMPKTRRNEVLSFIEGGLRDLSISRTSFKWGVPVPDEPDHIMYVWIDALTNYITLLGYPDVESADYKTFWPVAINMVGKDILRHHAVYWPAFLMAAGLKPPARVFAHGWWTHNGEKISKSLGNVIDPFEICDQYGLDPVRYFLMREVPFGKDGDFSDAALIRRNNGDLANDLGNLAQRTLSMIQKNCHGKLPEAKSLEERDVALLGCFAGLLDELRTHFDRQAIHLGLEAIWKQVAAANLYISAEEPWVLRKTDPERMATVLYVTAEAVRQLAILIQPVMPDSMSKMLDQLGVPVDARDFTALKGAPLKSGTPLPPPEGIFPRLEQDATGE